MVKIYAINIREISASLLTEGNTVFPYFTEEDKAETKALRTESLFGIFLMQYAAFHESELKGKLRISRTRHGKPYIEGRKLNFNISHSGRWAVCASSSHEIGVDIERIKPVNMRIAERFFSPAELSYLVSVPTEERDERFIDIWTLKESYIKYLGTGLATPLSSFSVYPDISGVISLGGNKVIFRQFDFVPGYKLAVCTEDESFDGNITVLSRDDITDFIRTVNKAD